MQINIYMSGTAHFILVTTGLGGSLGGPGRTWEKERGRDLKFAH